MPKSLKMNHKFNITSEDKVVRSLWIIKFITL